MESIEQKIEYMSIDLSPQWSLNAKKKQNELINRLNELGADGWILISGIEYLQYATFMRIVPRTEGTV